MTSKSVLTKAVLATIPELVASGLSRTEIAERLGCKLSTLKVRCSQERIRLPRRPRVRKLPAKTKRIAISTDAVAQFDSTADAYGMTANAFVSRLLELIVRDNLIDAILDEPTLLTRKTGTLKHGSRHEVGAPAFVPASLESAPSFR